MSQSRNLPKHLIPCPINSIMGPAHIAQTKSRDCPFKHKEYHWPPLEPENYCFTLIGDSIVKYVKHLPTTYVHAYPGTRIEWVEQKIRNQVLRVGHYKLIIFHLGCNNLHRQNEDEIEELFRSLISTTRIYNQTAPIVLSLVIPWVNESPLEKMRRERLNKKLIKLSTQIENCKFFSTYKNFTAKYTKKAIPELYAGGEKGDGIHLSITGTEVMEQYLDGNIKSTKGSINY